MVKRPFEFVEVELLDEWLSTPAGTKITILAQKARELVDRGVAEYANLEVKNKSISAPPINKMVASAPIKKAGRPKKNK